MFFFLSVPVVVGKSDSSYRCFESECWHSFWFLAVRKASDLPGAAIQMFALGVKGGRSHRRPIKVSAGFAVVVFHIYMLPSFAASISFDLPNFDRETKLTCSPTQKGLCLQGDAFLKQGLQLTRNQLHTSLAFSVGRAVYSEPVKIWDSRTGLVADFSAFFSFAIHGADSPGRPSGDGLAFFLSSYPSSIPDNSAGGFLGLFPNTSRRDGHDSTVAVEFDTYPNEDLDSTPADHIGIDVGHIVSAVELEVIGGIRRRGEARASVLYSAERRILTVTLAFADSSSELNRNSSISHVVDLRQVLPEYVSVGFSAATGSSVQTHTILSWSFCSDLEGKRRHTAMSNALSFAYSVAALFIPLLAWYWLDAADVRADDVARDFITPLKDIGMEKDGLEDLDENPIKGTTTEKKFYTCIDTTIQRENNDEQEPHQDEDSSLNRLYLEDTGESEAQITLQDSMTLAEEERQEENNSNSNSETEATEEDGRSQTASPKPVERFQSFDGLSPKEIPCHVLLAATNNFSEEMILGRGGFGSVYRGFISQLALDVAIKKLSQGSEQGMSEYMAEVKVITQLRHRNLVKLIGWCHEQGELMLVYEFLPNMSLDNHLFKEKGLLDWPTRYKIALGLANAVMYLHDECDPCVLHRDIKSSNVLLDSKLDPKLADFGLARLFDGDISRVRVSHPAGTRGYWAPEYALKCNASRRSDVYSYGVVALEIACGRKAILAPGEVEGEEGATLLVEWVWELYGRGAVLDAADRSLNGNFHMLEMQRLLEVGLWCAHPDHRQRPSIRQASNALLYPESTSPPLLGAKMPPWAFPLLAAVEVEMVQTPLITAERPSPTSSAYDDCAYGDPVTSTSLQDGQEALPEPAPHSKNKQYWFFPRLAWRLGKKKSTGSDESMVEKIRAIRGLREFSYQEIVEVTDNFSTKLDKTAYCSIYKGRLTSGMDVAVKMWTLESNHKEYYVTELSMLARLKHSNMVKLIGWSRGGGHHYFLVLEYMANGSLDRHLFGTLARSTMPWKARYKAALGLASALCYLHSNAELCVLHKNVAARTVLLDGAFNAKLGSLALARQAEHEAHLRMSAMAGTIGYLAPEYVMFARYSAASDVYSFGVLALEMASGRRFYAFDSSGGSTESLAELVWGCYHDGDLLRASDEKLSGEFDPEQMERLMVVGLWCALENPSQRPDMATALRALQFMGDPPTVLEVSWTPRWQ